MMSRRVPSKRIQLRRPTPASAPSPIPQAPPQPAALAASPPLPPVHSKTSRWDTWPARAANWSQPLLLLLGAFGYFYTVRPVFQNQLLQEQASRLELEKAESKRQLDSLVAQQDVVKAETLRLRNDGLAARARAERLARTLASTQEREQAMREASDAMLADLNQQREQLGAARWELALFDYVMARLAPRYNAIARGDDGPNPGDFIVKAGAAFKSPRDEMLQAIEVAEKRGGNRVSIPAEYWTEFRRYVDSNMSRLECPKPDYEVLRQSYLKEVRELPETVEAAVRDRIAEVRREYAEKNQRIIITDEYTGQVRRSERFGKEFALDQKYRKIIDDVRTGCQKKADAVFDSFRALKGVTR